MSDRTQHLTEKLQRLSKLVSEEVIMKSALKVPCSYMTLRRYLQGQVKKPQFAARIIEVLEEQLQVA